MTVLLGQQTGGAGTDFAASGNTALWPFVAVASGVLARIWCQLGIANAGFTAARLGTYDDAAGSPTGAPTSVASVSSLAEAQGAGSFHADIAGGPSIVSGTTYWIGVCGVGEQLDLNNGTTLAGVEGVGNFPTNPAGGAMGQVPIIWGETVAGDVLFVGGGSQQALQQAMGQPGVFFYTGHMDPPDVTTVGINVVTLAALVAGIGGIVADLSVSRALASAITGVGQITSNLKVSRAIAATVTGTSTVTPNLKVSRAIAALIAGTSTITPNLKVTRQLATLIAGTSAITANFKATRAIATVVAGTSTITGALAVTRRLNTLIVGVGTVTADLSTHAQTALAATVAGQAVITAALKVNRRFQTAVAGAAQIAANLTIIGSAPVVTITAALLRRRRLLRQQGGTLGRKRRGW